MMHRIIKGRGPTSIAVGVACVLSVAACGGGGSGSGQMSPQVPTGFTDIALVSNHVGVVATGTTIDGNLSNPWGLATAAGLPFWIADNNSNLATLYNGTGANQTTEVTGSNAVGIVIPASAAGVPANPNGQVYNGNGGFLIPTSKGQETAMFIFDGEGGTVAAW